MLIPEIKMSGGFFIWPLHASSVPPLRDASLCIRGRSEGIDTEKQNEITSNAEHFLLK
jgi:hypothetical protein